MPVAIPAGESIRFDVEVMPMPAGRAELEFDLYVDANNALFTDPVCHTLRFVALKKANPESLSLNNDGCTNSEGVASD
jgi:hypothetical protein